MIIVARVPSSVNRTTTNGGSGISGATSTKLAPAMALGMLASVASVSN